MLPKENLCFLSSKHLFFLKPVVFDAALCDNASCQRLKTNLAGNELMLSLAHINFVRIVFQVENVGSEYEIMSYFFGFSGVKCQEWKPCHHCD